jgi:hypothetical protein
MVSIPSENPGLKGKNILDLQISVEEKLRLLNQSE